MAHAGGTAAAAAAAAAEAFWTACPHCCHVHSYPRAYLGLRLRCPVPPCRRAFPASELPSPPPIVPGTDMYYCTWAFFPLGPPAAADASWVPFTPFHPFRPAPSTSPSPAPAPNPAAASADTPPRPMSRKKVGVCLKGRARAEAEEEEEATAAAVNLEAGAGGLGERDGSGIGIDIDINEAVDLSDLGFRVDEMGVLHALP